MSTVESDNPLPPTLSRAIVPAMVWPADYHMHTPLCHHATGQPTEYAARAVALGIKEIGFSDHSPMPQDDFDEWRMYFSKLDQYVADVRQAQKDHPQLTIKLALEVDYLPGQEDWIRKLARLHSWDYFIGSVHYISNSWAIDSPSKISEWKKHDPFEVWSIYFDRLTAAAESGLFEIIGHADLPKKFGIYPKQDCTPLFERFLKAAAKNNVAMELNTAGLRKDCKEIYPSQQIVQMARQHGVAITFGSDAHAPKEVGMNFTEAIELARSVGYTHYRRFTQRQMEAVPI
ncbi:MAG: Histidinol phosphate phosphatase HisJ family [Pedosphaera sp.]|nr:Histidinol phosphate phosphatase HisJ family [Pedosphaera sp.]